MPGPGAVPVQYVDVAGTARTRPPEDLARLLHAAAPYGVTADPAGTAFDDDGHLVVRLEVPVAAAGWAVCPGQGSQTLI